MCGLLHSLRFVWFIFARMWGHCSACPVLRHSESRPLGLSVRMWGRRVCYWSDCLPHLSHTPPVSVCHGHRSPLHPMPVSAPPTGLEKCLVFISLVSDFLAIRFSVSSGCARRRSVSTYTAILVLYIIDCVSASCFVLFLEYFPLLPLGHSSLPSHFG